VTQTSGVQLAVVNAAEGEEGRSVNNGPGVIDLYQDCLTQQITALREQVDVIVAVLHAGREFVPAPPPYVQRTYRALVNAGADLVVGHHPHVPQGVEVYQGRPIAYSLGNFALWHPNGSPFRRLGYLVSAQSLRHTSSP
jgi:poly-gamma-glutamate synthesis protein (capsule biosynthesis protein)